MGIFDDLAGAADHAAGSVDESIGRQFDDEVGGGIFDGTTSGNPVSEDTDGDGKPDAFNNRWLRGDEARTLYDIVMDYDGTLNGTEDSADVFGPAAWGTEGSVADVLVDREGEPTGPDEWKTKAFLVAIAGLVVLYLLAPLLQLGAEVAGDG